jgi:hypothetical protein
MSPRAGRLLVGLVLMGFVTARPVAAQEEEEAAFGRLLAAQAARHPRMEVQDLYKLVHQAALGSEHAVSDTAAARRWLAREVAALPEGPPDPLVDPLTPDSQLVRVHLRPFLAAGGDPEALLQAFVRTANTHAGSVDRLRRYWGYAVALAAAGGLPFAPDTLTAFFEARAAAGYRRPPLRRLRGGLPARLPRGGPGAPPAAAPIAVLTKIS